MMKLHKKIKSLHNDTLNQIKECNDGLEEKNKVIADLKDNYE